MAKGEAKGKTIMDTAENDGDEQAIEDAEHYIIKGMYVYSTLYTKSLSPDCTNYAPSGT